MSIDVAPSDLVPLSQAAKLFPRRRGNAKVSMSTLWRWYTRGSRGVRLQVHRVGGQVYVTREAVRDFIAARSSSADRAPQAPAPSTRSRRAMKELDRMGV